MILSHSLPLCESHQVQSEHNVASLVIFLFFVILFLFISHAMRARF